MRKGGAFVVLEGQSGVFHFFCPIFTFYFILFLQDLVGGEKDST